jgi:hypothetical protein
MMGCQQISADEGVPICKRNLRAHGVVERCTSVSLLFQGALPEWLTGAPAILHDQHRVWSLTACVRIAQASHDFLPFFAF